MAATDGFPVRDLVPADLPEAVALSAAVGWNQVEADWRIFLELGHAVAVEDAAGGLAATAATLPFGEGFGWISMVIVREDHRRRGIATRLLERSADELVKAGRTPGLDATPAGREVYLRLGFRDSWSLARWRRREVGRPVAPVDTSPRVRVRPIEAADQDAIERLDQSAFGADRRRLRERLLERSSGFAAVAEAGGRLCGFLLGREGRTATHIGPLVADREEMAVALAVHALGRITTPVSVDVGDRFSTFGRWLAANAFAVERPFTRMYLGRPEPFGDPRLTVAIAGPELG